MRSLARTSLAGIALVALCAGVAPSPVPTAMPSPSAVASSSPAAASSSPPAAASSSPSPVSKPAIETAEYRLETDEFVRKDNGDFTMPHKVAFSRPGSDGTADRAEGNTKRGTVSLFGNVVIHDNGKAPEAGSDDEYAKGGPSTLTCDQLDVDSKSKIYTAIGHVHFAQGARDMVAERGVLNRKTGMLHLDGHVKTKDGESSMTANNM
ncbi:MAG TPA: LPS export ABC transporter periplasmic protein LptC, partial [Candidatus Elarobacter sp.]|nr:LPS export ABC transporter periplasmic protein LptC [Candidatus Elarobacter sp.]